MNKNIFDFSNTFSTFKELCPILGCTSEGKTNYMMINWGGLGYLWYKPVCFVFIREDRYTYKFSEKGTSFSLSFLPVSPSLTKVFGSLSGRDTNKLKALNLTEVYDKTYDCYTIKEAYKTLKLKKLFSVSLKDGKYFCDIPESIYSDKPYHKLYICEILEYNEGKTNE